jgi:hypothetical protein
MGGPGSGNSSEPTLASAHLPDRPRQCFVLVCPILLLAQHGNAQLAFRLRSDIAHDAIDSDCVAPLVEAFDYDCSLARFHGGNMLFDPLIFVFLTSRKSHNELTRHGNPSRCRSRGVRRGRDRLVLDAQAISSRWPGSSGLFGSAADHPARI